MGRQRFTPEFKDEAVRQVTERGHPVTAVAARLGVSSHSLYKWVRAVRPIKEEERSDELLESKKGVLKLRAELRRVEEERDVHEDTVGPEVRGQPLGYGRDNIRCIVMSI
jgi:transposase